ncbi:MAG: hypothetical protein OXS29_00715 [bacterium]|nr:hypothetical protein [bacterium]MDE0288260.1 hypothetical protein [bacterium]MDE0438259.1 hypothetical protein [bacterium]
MPAIDEFLGSPPAEGVDPFQLWRVGTLSAVMLPELIAVPDPRGRYRAPLLQFIADWNRADNRGGLIAQAPVYDGGDPVLMPAIAVVVHALAERAGVPVPEWVLQHRAAKDVMLFGWPFDGAYARWVRLRSPAVCAHHRVWFHPRTLDKGTPDWWLPWD